MKTPRTKLDPGEQVLRRWRGNHRRSLRAATGGYLYLTSEQLLFEPHWFERLLGRAAWVVGHADVAEVETAQIPIAPGRRASRRLVVQTKSGAEEVFTVRSVDEAVTQIRTALR